MDVPEICGLEMIERWLLIHPAQSYLVITGSPDRAEPWRVDPS